MTGSAAALVLTALLALPTAAAGAEARLTTWLVLDPSYDNRLVVEMPEEVPGGPTRESRIWGGVRATIVVDGLELLLNQPLTADVEIQEIRIAGAPLEIFPGAPQLSTGTLCVAANPAEPSTGAVSLPVVSPPEIQADLHTQSFLQGPLGDLLPSGRIALSARIEDEVQADLRTLFANELTTGPVAVETTAEGTLPPEVVLLGGQPFELDMRILNSLAPPDAGPLLQECAAVGIH